MCISPKLNGNKPILQNSNCAIAITQKGITQTASRRKASQASRKKRNTQKASRLRRCPNFEPSPIGLIFSAKVNHYIQCTNIAFIWNDSIFFIFYETLFKVTSKLANLSWPTLAFNYKRRTLPKHSFFYRNTVNYFTCKSIIFPRYFNGLTIAYCQSLPQL